MLVAAPEEPLSLHTNILGAAAEERKGHHWARCYWYTEPAVVLSPADLRSLLAWVYRTPWSFLSRNNEDNCAIHCVEAPPPWIPNPWMPAAKLETVRRVLAEPGTKLCGACQERQGVVGAREVSLCRRCLVTMYSAAVSSAQEER
jgi:hypothetical protein